MGPGVHLHRSERTDVLVADLADMLADTPADPLTPDLVAVPTPGIERFISQGLGLRLGAAPGRADGVCANVDFPSPARIVNRVIAQATGVSADQDPWLTHRVVWPLLAVMDESAGEPWCHPLARHLGLDPTVGAPEWERLDRRFAVAARLARLFSAYASQRPSLLLDWAAGSNGDGAGGHVPDDLSWQPELWRHLRAEIGSPSPAERLDQACLAVLADPGVVDLPARLSFFGLSRLPADHTQVLTALASGREVHLWLADASPALWQNLTSGSGAVRRREDHSATIAHHPMLRSLGRDSRELRQRLGALAPAGGGSDTHHAVPIPDDTLLGHLQNQIRDNTDPWTQRATSEALRIAASDTSVQVHACHGQPRQAEVVREIVLGLLAADPTLEPRDILLMCPDLTSFAPLLSAAFSESPVRSRGADGARSLKLRIADRTPEQSNEVLGALAVLLQMVTGRMGLSDVLDFAGRPPVRARFGFDDDSLERLETLATHAGIRWGLDAVNRADFLVQVPTGTWQWGLDRLMLGVTMSDVGLHQVNGVLPVDDVQGGDVAAVGRLAELVTRLLEVRDECSEEHPPREWASILTSAVTDLMDARGADAWQLSNALGAVDALESDAGAYGDSVELCLADVRWMLGDLLEGRPTRSNFRSGALTVCGLAPMRSVPHRVICLVGMDDAAFPRASAADGDDVLARDPLIGERDRRSEDRQLLLDALMAASDNLVITYTGADDRTNEPRPPCVPLGELLDTLDSMAVAASGGPARGHVLVHHPLQPFDPRNFTSGALGGTGPFSHDLGGLDAARRAAGPRPPRPPFLVGDLPAAPVCELTLGDLGSFLAAPPAAFLRARIGLSLRGEDEPPADALPIELDALARWSIGDRVLGELAGGAAPTDVAAAERARGQLPPGALGAADLSEIGNEATELAEHAAALRDGPARQVSVRMDLSGGIRLLGTVPDIHGTRIVRAMYARPKPTQQVRVWPELLAAAAAAPGGGWAAHLVTRGEVQVLAAPEPEEAQRILAELAQLYVSGLVAPLPVTVRSGYEYARARSQGKPVDEAVAAARNLGWEARFGPERDLPEVVTLWGSNLDFGTLLAEQPRDAETWFTEDATRFGRLARRIWEPILAARQATS